ncbi:unnamed protein product [Brachionus calyciflorus]|uniref:Uncharacterized protein n=1 Tax=Brachionus calyciflorus TaxID=104777 RepID=A0A813M5J4_9BILA|nr:unnamed protein product [Brachionus calyciflorus]
MVIDLRTESPLIQAVFTANLDEVKSLLNKKVEVNHQSQNGKIRALHVAAHCSGNFKPVQKEEAHESDVSDEGMHEIYIEIVRLLCKFGARVNIKDTNQLTPLHYACRSNSHKAVEILLENQADVNSRDKNWQTPLHICSMYNSVECARLILPYILNIDASDKQGRSALAHACFNGHYEMVEILLENGANCNIHDKQERKPIHWASFMGYCDLVELLLKNGADVNSLDKDLYTPLLAACASGKSEETIKLLVENGADTSSTTAHDSTIFHLACLNGHDQIVRDLLNIENLAITSNSKGYHPLHYAASCRRGAICVELLISLNFDVNLASYYDNKSPMHLAALHGITSSAQILFSNGALINVKDSDSNTPLHLAASNGQTSMVEFLVESGANIYIRGLNGLLPWGLAALNGHFECFRVLEKIIPTISTMKQYFETRDDFDRTFMHLAALSGNYECLIMFIRCDCDVNAQDKYGNTPLHYACAGSYLKCVELLIRSGADVNETNNSLYGLEMANLNDFKILGQCATPLMLACAFDQDGYVVRELKFSAKAKADMTDKNGYNTLHYAAVQGNRNVFEIILKECRNLDHQKNEHLTSPLHILCYYGHREALEFLLRTGFEPELRDINGRTALDIACFKGEILCVDFLVTWGANYETHDDINARTPLHAAAYNNNYECLRFILSFHKNKLANSSTNSDNFISDDLVNIRDKHQRTPLMYAVEQGHLTTINFLINEYGADVLISDEKQRTALHRAAALGYEECCQAILSHNAFTANQRDLNGMIPIHYAIMNGHASLIQIFFDYHVTIGNFTRLLDKDKFSLLHFACFNGHSTCVETICELGETYECLIEMLFQNSETYNSFSPLHLACENSHEACVNFLIDKYNDKLNLIIELEDSNGNRPLHICAIKNEYDCASLLLESNCQINSKNNLGQTPFMLAAFHNSFTIMELLFSDEGHKTQNLNDSKIKINHKIDLSTTDKDGNTALHLALLNQHENSALFILDRIESNSILINLKNKDGQTPLHLASMNGLVTVVEILLSKGADIWLKNSKNHTPLLSCAKNTQVADCLEILLSRLILSFNQKNMPNQSAHNTPSFMLMMGQNTSSAMSNYNRETRNNLNNSINDLTSNFNRTKSLMGESNYTLTTSDIILNDVNMNQMTSGATSREKNEKDKKLNSTNLNSTLILNENEIILESNVSSTVGSIEGLNVYNNLNSTVNDEKYKQQVENEIKFNARVNSSESLGSNDSEYY